MSTGKKRVTYYDSDGEEKVWSGYPGGPEPEHIAGSTLELPSLQQEQLSDWA
jgi:DNA-binding protein H-NS